jgi:hypothetical protein
MSKAKDEVRAEYRREDLGKGVRGKYFGRVSRGTNLVLLDEKVAKAFRTSEAVNEALHGLLSLTEQTARITRGSSGRTKKRAAELASGAARSDGQGHPMIRGSCLCGGVTFEFARTAGPFELCHCTRCRKVSGSAYRAGLRVQGKDFRLVAGKELIKTFDAPTVEAPPPYRQCFCGRCGCPVPFLRGGAWFVPAGLLDDDPGIRPDKHIYVELKAPWDTIADQLPQMTRQDISAHRARAAHKA